VVFAIVADSVIAARAAATGKARSPTADSRMRLTISDEDELRHYDAFLDGVML